MALYKTNHAKGTIPVPVSVACEVVVYRARLVLSAALAANDIIHAGFLPAGHVPVDIILDAANAGKASVGLLNADSTDIDTAASGGAAWLTEGDAAAQAGLRADAGGLFAMSRCASDDNADRAVGIKATGAFAAGEIGLTLLYRSA